VVHQQLLDSVVPILSRARVPETGSRTPPDPAPAIDHTLLRPEAVPADVDRLCEEAVRFGFATVCVNPALVERAAARLGGSTVRVGTVAGFPLGADLTGIKGEGARRAIELGAGEIDMVMNVGAMKAREFQQVEDDIHAVAAVCAAGGAVLKVILETALLADSEKVLGALLAREAGAGFVKTSTGFAAAGATVRDIAILKAAVGDTMGIKASGGIRTLAQASALMHAGATRLGTSTGVRIVEEFRKEAVR
jgi:deoxyribose-phosphate aldolase